MFHDHGWDQENLPSWLLKTNIIDAMDSSQIQTLHGLRIQDLLENLRNQYEMDTIVFLLICKSMHDLE